MSYIKPTELVPEGEITAATLKDIFEDISTGDIVIM